MDRARAMLDALMGPGRDQVEKDTTKTKEKFKDSTVCKPYLVGLCPMDPGMLGGKRAFPTCDKIHSEIMREQYEKHSNRGDFEWEYKLECLKSLEYAVRECDSRILNEKARIRDDWGNRRPPLPVHVIDSVSRLKRESSAMFAMAEQMDDDRIKEKEALITRSGEIMKEAEALEEKETKKAIATAVTEEVCEICGSTYQGAAADSAHKKFRVHGAYTEVREKLEELRACKEELEKKKKEKEGEDSKKRTEDSFKKSKQDKDDGADPEDNDKDNRKKREESRPRSSDKRKKEERGRDRRRNDSKERSRSRRGGRDRNDRRKSRGRSRDKGGRRDSSRSRRRR